MKFSKPQVRQITKELNKLTPEAKMKVVSCFWLTYTQYCRVEQLPASLFEEAFTNIKIWASRFSVGVN